MLHFPFHIDLFILLLGESKILGLLKASQVDVISFAKYAKLGSIFTNHVESQIGMPQTLLISFFLIYSPCSRIQVSCPLS